MSSNYLMISNQGEVEIGAFTLIGASSKRGDASKIGMFGSGAKLALAVLMRDGLTPIIYSGQKEFRLCLEDEDFRGETYQRLSLKAGATFHQTSITTQAGHTWGTEEALRDIISNALDEDSSPRIRIVPSPSRKSGETRIFIPHSHEVEEFYQSLSYYFTFKRTPLYVQEGGDNPFRVYSKIRDDQSLVYRRGVQCYSSNRPSLYDYDLPNITIGENRKADPWVVRSVLPPMFNRLPLSYKRDILKWISDTNSRGILTLEGETNPRYDLTSPDWKDATDGRIVLTAFQSHILQEEIKMKPVLILPELWCEELWTRGALNPKDMFDSSLLKGFKITPPKPWETSLLEKASSFLKSLGYVITCPILLFETEGDGAILGEYDPKGDKILLNRKILEEFSLQKVSSILLEEYAHKETSSPDKSRSLQNWCFSEIIRLGLEIKGREALL